MEGFHRQEGGTRSLLAKEKTVSDQKASFLGEGNSGVFDHVDHLTSADLEISD